MCTLISAPQLLICPTREEHNLCCLFEKPNVDFSSTDSLAPKGTQQPGLVGKEGQISSQSQKSRTPPRSLLWVPGTQPLKPSLRPFRTPMGRKLEGEAEPGLKPKLSVRRCGSLTHHLTPKPTHSHETPLLHPDCVNGHFSPPSQVCTCRISSRDNFRVS